MASEVEGVEAKRAENAPSCQVLLRGQVRRMTTRPGPGNKDGTGDPHQQFWVCWERSWTEEKKERKWRQRSQPTLFKKPLL